MVAIEGETEIRKPSTEAQRAVTISASKRRRRQKCTVMPPSTSLVNEPILTAPGTLTLKLMNFWVPRYLREQIDDGAIGKDRNRLLATPAVKVMPGRQPLSVTENAPAAPFARWYYDSATPTRAESEIPLWRPAGHHDATH